MIRSASISSYLPSNGAPGLQCRGHPTAARISASSQAAVATHHTLVPFKNPHRRDERDDQRSMLKRPRRSGCPRIVSINVLMIGHRVLVRTVTIGHDPCGRSMLMMRRDMRPVMMTVVMTVVVMTVVVMVTVVAAVLMRVSVTVLVAVHGPVHRRRGDADHLSTPQATAQLRDHGQEEQDQPRHRAPSIGRTADRPRQSFHPRPGAGRAVSLAPPFVAPFEAAEPCAPGRCPDSKAAASRW
jgi:hypothetical protein